MAQLDRRSQTVKPARSGGALPSLASREGSTPSPWARGHQPGLPSFQPSLPPTTIDAGVAGQALSLVVARRTRPGGTSIQGVLITAQQATGVAATAKHFPGLGAATKNQNTDLGR